MDPSPLSTVLFFWIVRAIDVAHADHNWIQYGGPPSYQGMGGFASYQNPPRGADPQCVGYIMTPPSGAVHSQTAFVRTFRLWSWFVSVDKDRSGAISLQELRKYHEDLIQRR
jgi:hypothetical protein